MDNLRTPTISTSIIFMYTHYLEIVTVKYSGKIPRGLVKTVTKSYVSRTIPYSALAA